MQDSIYGYARSPSSPWTDLAVWNPNCQCQLNSVCLALHALQFATGTVMANIR